jgi:hypothetical protein
VPLCAGRAFHVVVKGTNMATVVFKLDGKVVDRFPSVIANTATLRVNPAKFPFGRHRVTARVTFKPGTRTKAKTLRLTFQHCREKVGQPQFTG